MTVRILNSFDKSKFDVNANTLLGITLALDSTLWICDSSTSTIYNVTQAGSLVAPTSKFLTTSTEPGAISPTGISQDTNGSLWWSESSLGKIYNTTITGTLISSFLMSGVDVNAILVQGVSYSNFDDTLWACDPISGKAYNITKAGVKISEFPISKMDSNATNINDISALDDGTLLLCDPSTSKVYHTKRDGTKISEHLSSQWNSNDPNGISGSNERSFWTIDAITDTAYNVQVLTADFRISSTKEDAITDWVETVTGISFFWNRQDTHRPAMPYGILNIVSGPNKEGNAAIKYKTLDTFTYLFKKTFTLSIDIIADNQHLRLMSDILDSLELPSFLTNLRIAGLAYRGNSDIFDISELLNAKDVRRCTVDIFFAYGQDKDDVSGQVDKIKAAGTIDSKTINISSNATNSNYIWTKEQNTGNLDFADIDAISSLAFAVGGSIRKRSGGVWSIESGTGSNFFYSVKIFSSTFAMAVGDNGAVYEWNGTVWSSVLGADPSMPIMSVDILSQSFTAMIGFSGIYHYNGSTLSLYSSGMEFWGYAIKLYSATFGMFGGLGRIGLYDGVNWSTSIFTFINFYALSIYDQSLAFIVGDNGTIVKWNGSTFNTESGTGSDTFRSVDIFSSTLAAAVGDNGSFYLWDGVSWSQIATGITEQMKDVKILSNSSIIICGNNDIILEYDGTTITKVQGITGSNLLKIAENQGTIFIAGQNGIIYSNV